MRTHLFFLTLLHLLILSASATDTLRPGQWIGSTESLVSSNQMFEFGFFSPGNSSNHYVGIWYHNISEQTVVWVANRDRPVVWVAIRDWPLADQLTFTRDGNLMVVDGMGASSVFTYGSGINDRTTATLLDTGNLVLRDARGRILWQSFDNPTDHFLPGMLLGSDGWQNRLLTSWKSSDDPSTGDYIFGAETFTDNLEFITWQQGVTTEWSTGLWDGSKFSNISSQMSLYFKYVSTGGVDYLSFVNPGGTDHSQRTRAVINENGQFSILIWVSKSQEWSLLFSEPRGGCDVVNICGPNTVCSVIGGKPSCECVRGFQPWSLTNWRKGDREDGCVRKTNLQCLRGVFTTDVFLSLPHVKFPLNGSEQRLQRCESDCLADCDCNAYAYAYEGICQFWYGDIATLQQLDHDDGVYYTAGTLYVRLAASELSSNLSSNSSASTVVFNNDNKKKLKIGISLTVVFVAISCVLVGSFLWWRRQKGREKLSQEQSILLLGAEIAKELGQNGKRAPEFTLFDFSQISDATNGFSNENKLGEGGFGPVYKGILREGQEIAVKRLSTRSGQGLEEFKNEILLIAKLQHSNLVRLLGCCIQKEEKILIYEYMQNKSLDFFIFDKERGSQLDWSRRRHIVEGIAQGIIYLHKHSRLRIIHRDLKASNVLLDAEMNPKISDFGMARIFNPNEAVTNTIRVVGTYGYMSPEYAIEGIFSVKSDVFSFGVLLLEIVSGKRNTSFHQYKNALNLVGYAWELWLEAKLSDLADPSLGDICPLNDITRCIHVALLCVQEKAIDRPTMTEIITMLSSETASLVDPRQPAFVTMSVPRETDLPRKTSSVNNVTITSMDGR